MAGEKEAFVERWSRLKREADAKAAEAPAPAEAPKPAAKQDTPPALPPVEKLTPDSDFAAFMNPKVSDALRRAALKKLFADPRFNVPDPFEAYSGDWTSGDVISEEMLKKLDRARAALSKVNEAGKNLEVKPPAPKTPEEGALEEKVKDDGAGRKDA